MGGLKCRIERRDDRVTGVMAPNGAWSELYNGALVYTGDREAALNVWATAYTEEFASFFGEWRRGVAETHGYGLDRNGEPLLDDVLHYLDMQRSVVLSARDMRDLRNVMTGMPDMTVDGFMTRMWDAFHEHGRFTIDERRLSASGIYTDDEVYRIVNDAAVQNSIFKIQDSIFEIPKFNDSKIQILEDSAPGSFAVGAVHEDRMTVFGKRATVNPAVVERTLRDALGGIRDRAAFDGAVAALPYDEVIARYADRDYADGLFERYSAYTAVPVVEIRDSELSQVSDGAAFPGVASGDVSKGLTDAIDMFVLIDGEAERPGDDAARKLLHRIALESARTGIDMTELQRAYGAKPLSEVQDFMTAYHVYLRDGNDRFGGIYDRFFEKGKAVEKARLDSRLEGLSVVKVRDWYGFPANYLFAGFGLIDMGGGFFHHVSKIQDSKFEIQNSNIPGFNDSGGRRLRKMAGREDMPPATEDAQAEAEQLVLSRLIYGHPGTVREVNVADERARYYAFDGNWYDTTYAFPRAFYRFMLEEKVKGTELYADVLSHFRLSPEIELLDTDAGSISDIEELMPEGKMKRGLANYAHISRSPTLAGLFLPAEAPGPDTMGFRQYLYANSPQLLPAFAGVYTDHADGSVSVENGTEDFIKINGDVMVLRSTEGNVSTYRPVGVAGFESTNRRDFPDMNVEERSVVERTDSTDERMTAGSNLYGQNDEGMRGFEC
jgi:hypothetical protein